MNSARLELWGQKNFPDRVAPEFAAIAKMTGRDGGDYFGLLDLGWRRAAPRSPW